MSPKINPVIKVQAKVASLKASRAPGSPPSPRAGAANPRPDIVEIIFEEIDEDHGWGMYGDLKVIIRKADGYMNGNKLATLEKKRFENWARPGSVKFEALIDAVSRSTRIRVDLLMVSVLTGPNELRGTYIHPLLAPHLASWVSADFGVMVSRIVNDHFVKDIRDKLKAAKASLQTAKLNLLSSRNKVKTQQKALGEKDELIVKLEEAATAAEERHKEAMQASRDAAKLAQQHADESEVRVKELLAKVKFVKKVVVKTKAEVERVQDKLGVAVVDRVIKPESKAKLEKFMLLKDPEDEEYPFYAMCGQASYIRATLKKYRAAHPDAETLLEFSYEPNAKNILIRTRERLREHISTRGNKIKIDDDSELTEQELKETIEELANEKLDVESSGDEDE